MATEANREVESIQQTICGKDGTQVSLVERLVGSGSGKYLESDLGRTGNGIAGGDGTGIDPAAVFRG